MIRRASSLLALALALAIPRAALAFGDLDDPGPSNGGEPGQTWATFDASYVRFTRFFDGDGHRRPLDAAYGAFGQSGKDIAIDALVVSFEGRYVLGPGCSAGVKVPLVRDSRSGRVPIAPGIDQSVYAEGSAIGDLVGDIALEVPFGDDGTAFGGAIAVQGPTGQWKGLEPSQLPTGNGAFGAGGELFAVWRGEAVEAGAAAGMLALLPRHQGGGDVDLGDPIWGRAFAAARVGANVRAGLELSALSRGADRVGGTPVSSTGAIAPGSLEPASSLVTITPYVDGRLSRYTSLRVSISNPGAGWLFVPVDTGIALRGKNVLAAETQIRGALVARF